MYQDIDGECNINYTNATSPQDDNVSFSMFIDKSQNINLSEDCNIYSNETDEDSDDLFQNAIMSETPPDPFTTIQSRTRLRWAIDSNSTNCQNCKKDFRIYRRRHHCIIKGTPITLATGKTVKIEDIKPNLYIKSWDTMRLNITNGITGALLDQGYEMCFKLKLEDGRELISTLDHKILCILSEDTIPKYVMMKHLTPSHRIICLLMSGEEIITIYKNYVKMVNNHITFDKFLKMVEYDWDNGKRYISLGIWQKPVIYDHGNLHKVYDISVPEVVSFAANGILVHNCRQCGSIFCNECSNNWNPIPECITHIPTSTGLKAEIDRTKNVRLCDKCNEKIELIKKLEILLKSTQSVEMDLFTFNELGCRESTELTDSFIKHVNDIPDLQNLECLDDTMDKKIWMQLANFYLSKFREIQYKLPYQQYTEWEKNALWTNYKYLKNHNVWMVHVIRAFESDKDKLDTIVNYYFNNEYVQKNKDECWIRMCTRSCQPTLSWQNSLVLLEVVNSENLNNDVRNILTEEIIKSFDINDDLFENILPCITHNLIYERYNNLLIEYIMKRCSNSEKISNNVYWAIKLEKNNHLIKCENLLTMLFREIPRSKSNILMNTNTFVQTIEDNYVGDTNLDEPIKNLDQLNKCISPVNPELGVQTIIPTILPGEPSASRPVPIILSHNDKTNVILYKKEDLRTDAVVMSIIKIMHKIVQESMNIDLHVITYNIQPITTNSGFIGAVNKCKTLYTIEEKMKLSLANYIKKYNPNISSNELSERFIRSCAFYSVITFLLGIGDRHLDNIMLTENGNIFHIDYGFILGKDPKHMSSPHMRITEGMLDAIGGYHSESYQEFKELCYDIYDIMRRHVNVFVCLLSLLPKQNSGGTGVNPKISDDRVLREIVKRFAPGETYDQAKSLLHSRIEKSTNITSISKYHIVDFFHRHNKEGTLGNILSNTVDFTLNGTKNLMQGIWSYIYPI